MHDCLFQKYHFVISTQIFHTTSIKYKDLHRITTKKHKKVLQLFVKCQCLQSSLTYILHYYILCLTKVKILATKHSRINEKKLSEWTQKVDCICFHCYTFFLPRMCWNDCELNTSCCKLMSSSGRVQFISIISTKRTSACENTSAVTHR